MKPLALIAIFCLALVSGAHAGEGHDHGDASPAANSSGPKRLPDGGVFMPKPAQRQIGVRTQPVEEGALPRAFELSGKVVMDPNAGGKVQALIAGRLEPGPRGFPSLGQRVNKGEVLAWVVPSAGMIERSNQSAQLAELRATKGLAEKRLTRLKELADTIPRKEIEAAESEVDSLNGRIAALGAGLSNRDALVAPVTGVVAMSNAVAGQVVEAREAVFEVVDPNRSRVEALAYDTAQALDVVSGSLAVGDARVPLAFVGAARSLREQALPLMFRGEGNALANLALGQPVKVFALTRSTVQGYRVPAAALVKNPANQAIVWVKTAPERFEPRTVTVEPLDGANVAVTTGLKAGDRVVVRGATLVNQVR
ncbi:MAG: HlyD family efflux transporter periplasmic adaptor subunit [Pseudomonadota bacterium]|jgi:cobalt-zinc-cadmium efflux system membrane fusion protein|nr:HlyD family efflux transporter periplasmic adaptor subunit [Hydrogenophilales bacterium]MCU0842404.1 HlyD family efflux transporter periplasmic adaptor subunit [Thiobacillaceae bacterium]